MSPRQLTVLQHTHQYTQWRCKMVIPGTKIGFVPTKGSLHDVDVARQQCDLVVVTIVTSESQFANPEDFQLFPRQISNDLELLEECGLVDVVLLPKLDELFKYGPKHGARIHLESDLIPREYVNLEILAGECTMLTKLLNVIQPTHLYIGQRDIIRATILRRLVDDLLYPVDVITLPIARDDDGIVFDARLERLSEVEREAVRVVYRALNVMVSAYLGKTFKSEALIALGRRTLQVEPMLGIEFIRIAHPYGFQDIQEVDPVIGAIVVIQVMVGRLKHLDNVILAPLIQPHDQRLWSPMKSNVKK